MEMGCCKAAIPPVMRTEEPCLSGGISSTNLLPLVIGGGLSAVLHGQKSIAGGNWRKQSAQQQAALNPQLPFWRWRMRDGEAREVFGLAAPSGSAAGRDGEDTQHGGCLRSSDPCSKSGWWWRCMGCPHRSQLHCVACEPGAAPLCLCCVPGVSLRGLCCLPATFWGVR